MQKYKWKILKMQEEKGGNVKKTSETSFLISCCQKAKVMCTLQHTFLTTLRI